MKYLKKLSFILLVLFITIFSMSSLKAKSDFDGREEIPCEQSSACYKAGFRNGNLYDTVIYEYNRSESHVTTYTTDDIIPDSELKKITYLSFYHEINDLTGIEKLTGLKTLNMAIGKLKEFDLDFSNLTNLESLVIRNALLNSIDISENTKLESLTIENANLKSIDVTDNVLLKDLSLPENKLESVDLSKNLLLEELDIGYNLLKNLDLNKNVKLTSLQLYNNEISEIDLSKNIMLKYLDMSSNRLKKLDLSKKINLVDLSIPLNYITDIDLNENLESLVIDLNAITKEKLQKLQKLEELGLNASLYLNDEVNLNDYIPSSFNKNLRLDEGLLELTDNNVLKATNYGVETVYNEGYRFYVDISVFDKIESNKYDINYDKKIIYTLNDSDEEILSNITIGNEFPKWYFGDENITYDLIIDDGELIIQIDDHIIDKFLLEKEPKVDSKKDDKVNNPKTYDNGLNYFITTALLLIILSVFIKVKIFDKKNKNI